MMFDILSIEIEVGNKQIWSSCATLYGKWNMVFAKSSQKKERERTNENNCLKKNVQRNSDQFEENLHSPWAKIISDESPYRHNSHIHSPHTAHVQNLINLVFYRKKKKYIFVWHTSIPIRYGRWTTKQKLIGFSGIHIHNLLIWMGKKIFYHDPHIWKQIYDVLNCRSNKCDENNRSVCQLTHANTLRQYNSLFLFLFFRNSFKSVLCVTKIPRRREPIDTFII